MPLADLLAALERDAEEKAQAELEAARAAAAGAEADAAARTEGRRAAYVARREAELRGAVERAVADGRRRARATTLAARQRLLDRVFEAARAALPAVLTDPAFLAGLPAQLGAARAYLSAGGLTVRCRPEIAAAVRAAAADVTVVEDSSAGTGLRLVSADGAAEVDDTLEARFERLRPRLALEILRRLAEDR